MTDLVFSALADARRRDILLLLRKGERNSGDLAGHFRVSWPAVSRDLRLLKQAKLVQERRLGRERLYTLNRPQLVRVLGGWVAAFDARWAESLENLKRQLESPSNTSKERSNDSRR